MNNEPHRDWGGFLIQDKYFEDLLQSLRRVFREFKDHSNYSEVALIMSNSSPVFYVTVTWQLSCDE